MAAHDPSKKQRILVWYLYGWCPNIWRCFNFLMLWKFICTYRLLPLDQRPTLSTEFAQNANAHNDQFLVTKKAKGRLSAGPTSSMDSESPRRTKARPVRQWSETGRHIRRYPLSPNAMSSPSYDPSSPALHEAVSAWFLGPQAENADLLKTLFNQIVDSHTEARISYHPEDGVRIVYW